MEGVGGWALRRAVATLCVYVRDRHMWAHRGEQEQGDKGWEHEQQRIGPRVPGAHQPRVMSRLRIVKCCSAVSVEERGCCSVRSCGVSPSTHR